MTETRHEETLYEKGLAIRREVLGSAYVDASLANADSFMSVFQDLTTTWCWGFAWGREGIDRRTRSIVNLAMLTALGKPQELGLHVRGAVNNGVSVEEIQEVLVQATVYCGIPAGLEAFKVAQQVLRAEGVLPAVESTGPAEASEERG
jgi:4-carboxymuconolactone decarboxylase